MTPTEILNIAREIDKNEKILARNPNFIKKAFTERKLKKAKELMKSATPEEKADINDLLRIMRKI